MTTVLKLGGSVITEKDTPETVDEGTLERAADAIGDSVSRQGTAPSDLVVVHGGGSFGHPHAARHGVSTTEGTHDAAALRDIHAAMTDLSDAVVDALAAAGVPALPVRPLSVASLGEEGGLTLPATQIETMLTEGFVPVVHGDVVAHAGKGGTVLSGDDIVVSLAQTLSAARVGLCSTVPGVLNDEGEVIPEITDFEDVSAVLGGSDTTDVTGGMAAKVRKLLDVSVPATIFAPSDLPEFLDGNAPGTVICGGTAT